MKPREAPICPEGHRPSEWQGLQDHVNRHSDARRVATNQGFLSAARGFTLIEVMAALAIVTIGMLAVILAVTQTASNNAYLRDKAVAHWVAMNQLTQLRLQAQPPPTGDTSGETEMGGRRWHWTTRVSPTDVASMRRIDVGVRPAEDSDGDGQLASITGFYGAKIAQPGTVVAQF